MARYAEIMRCGKVEIADIRRGKSWPCYKGCACIEAGVFEKFGVIPVGRYEQSYFSDSSKCPNCAYGERVKLDHLVKVTLFRTVTEGIQCPMMIVQAGDTIPKGWITGWVKRVDK